MPAHKNIGPWLITDSGVQTGSRNMGIDRSALESAVRGLQRVPTVRFFQWERPVVSYGYLMSPSTVRSWMKAQGLVAPLVKRPTGGGVVVHDPNDLSVSLLWPRASHFLPERPRACYEAIHTALQAGLRDYLGEGPTSLFVKEPGSCATADAVAEAGTAVCFEQPVCNDVMLGSRKVIGGALRLTRQAILYQGTIQLKRIVNFQKMKACLLRSMADAFLSRGRLSTVPSTPVVDEAPILETVDLAS